MVEMRNWNIVLNALMLLCVCLIVASVYFFNTWYWGYFPIQLWIALGIQMSDLFFVESMFFIALGLLLMLGRGGINARTIGNILKSSIADWIYGRESDKERVRPSELLHADRWKPKGLRRTSLTLIIAGASMMLIYVLGL